MVPCLHRFVQVRLIYPQHDTCTRTPISLSALHSKLGILLYHSRIHFASKHTMSFWDWTARIECEKYELGQSYTVIVFLGEVPKDPMDWLICPQFVGAHHAIVDSGSGGNRGPVLEEGFVHLSTAIAERSHLGSLEPSAVEPYLKRNLNWRVQKKDESAAQLNSLEVCIFATRMIHPPDSDFPVPAEKRRFGAITHGRQGGCRSL